MRICFVDEMGAFLDEKDDRSQGEKVLYGFVNLFPTSYCGMNRYKCRYDIKIKCRALFVSLWLAGDGTLSRERETCERETNTPWLLSMGSYFGGEGPHHCFFSHTKYHTKKRDVFHTKNRWELIW